MLTHDYLEINSKNHLVIGGCDSVELAAHYGTPLYVMDENRIRENMRQYKKAFESFYDGNGLPLYASKAFSAVAMYKLAGEEGFGVDVVSGGELYTALKAGFDASKIVFHGNNKSSDEIRMAIENGVGRIVTDSFYELENLETICRELDKKVKILIRVKPGVDAHTHEFISTGHIDCKFGFRIDTGEAEQAIKTAMESNRIELMGLHCHIGSQIFLLDPFELTAEVMMNFYSYLKEKYGYCFPELNLGGGFGIKYVEGDSPVDYGSYIEAVSVVVKKICSEKGLDIPFIYMEPGRSIVGDAGTTLYTAGVIKDIEGARKYVSIDGGMGDNPRYMLYESEYEAIVANRANSEPVETATLCGKCCESGDIIIHDGILPEIESGDIVAVMSTGAYNYSMASNYNRLPRPAVVFVSDGKSRVAVKRETYEDLIKNDVF